MPETGGNDDGPPEDAAEEWRPERNWLLIIVGAACVVIGVRAVYVGLQALETEGVLPGWFGL